MFLAAAVQVVPLSVPRLAKKQPRLLFLFVAEPISRDKALRVQRPFVFFRLARRGLRGRSRRRGRRSPTGRRDRGLVLSDGRLALHFGLTLERVALLPLRD